MAVAQAAADQTAVDLLLVEEVAAANPYAWFPEVRTADEIAMSPVGSAVNGKLLPHTAPLDHDTDGRPLVQWPSGSYTATPGTLWVASSYNARSYDSRYFGPIRESTVRARLRPLIAW